MWQRATILIHDLASDLEVTLIMSCVFFWAKVTKLGCSRQGENSINMRQIKCVHANLLGKASGWYMDFVAMEGAVG